MSTGGRRRVLGAFFYSLIRFLETSGDEIVAGKRLWNNEAKF